MQCCGRKEMIELNQQSMRLLAQLEDLSPERGDLEVEGQRIVGELKAALDQFVEEVGFERVDG